jgi:nicotinate-nucleotide pyrophosphorylase (carboxylating)
VDIIMLDNMSSKLMKKAVDLINGRAKIEASGNMTLKRIRKVAATGVNYISIGALTHSVKALDITMRIIN